MADRPDEESVDERRNGDVDDEDDAFDLDLLEWLEVEISFRDQFLNSELTRLNLLLSFVP